MACDAVSPQHAGATVVVPGSAGGIIVTDVTAGEFATREQGTIDPLGLVDEPIRLTVSDGRVVDVAGGAVAGRLGSCLDSVGRNARMVVELGFGLSAGVPIGQIGPDECLQGTFHFGIGDDSFFGGSNPGPAMGGKDLLTAGWSVLP